MTLDDLARIEARAAAATDGPWEASGIDVLRSRGPWEGQDDVPLTAADADFIAHARTDVPALIAYARELEAERDAALARVAHAAAIVSGDAGWRDADARAALARVEALCDEVGPWTFIDDTTAARWRALEDVRAAITGPTPTAGDTRA